MRSAIFEGAGKPLAIEEREIPRPAAGQAVIRVCRCGICASDLSMTGGSPFDMPAGTAPGHEYAGEVVEAGAESGLKPGDRVTALPIAGCGTCPACRADAPLQCAQMRSMAGGYSEYALVDGRASFRLPDALSFTDGALVEPLASSLRGIRRLEIAPDSRIAVIGAGAIGAGAIYWLRQKGVGRITAIARTRRGADLVDTMGADGLVTTGEGLNERVAELLGGAPDIVVEGAGAPGLLQQAIELVGWNGQILSLGGCMKPDPIVPFFGMIKEATIRFSVAYGRSEFREVLDTLEAGHMEPHAMIGDTISLTDLPARFEAMRTGSHPAKVMVDPTLA
ncbi:alcohol dehydrogenase catalytic domain-containing protein [Croceicoccus mobilis]|uniref:Zn-dependent alcohol dehydrogenase n=1 Tax=Croceicoccus mobilis TaxID=1703339 RepID=A0A917DX81_9SPHN|nr:alcohol dehydrogenase catalytic domain-containing protein [Croceicoccus mobilis]GGD80226.1 Zn-dependent alcohol dehydrogenase [Croceicoccus mobilis]